MRKGLTIIVFLLLGYLFHLSVDWARMQSFDWASLYWLPSWTPTEAGFQRIWAGIYILVSISGALFWLAPRETERTKAVFLWCGIVVLSAAWHFAFFYFHSLLATALSASLLLVVVGFAMRAAKKVDEAAAVFLAAYQIWNLYAAVLFWTIFFMN